MVNSEGFDGLYPMKTNSKTGSALNTFVQTFGIPNRLATDGAMEEYHGEWQQAQK